MHAVIFEVWPKEEGRQEYLDIAAALKPRLEQIDGFVSIERFQSLTEPGKVLSLSFWRDDAAIAEWRRVEAHRMAQAKGRNELFRDYRLRIAAVADAPADSKSRHG
jgi:heme-degrading monooxygenase HmoA